VSASDASSLPPLRMSFEVACAPEAAFDTWTRRFALWWPADHTVSGAPEHVQLEPGIGGRIHELGPDGTEHEWGRVTVWEPPHRLGYLWHLRRDRADATEVEITFRPRGPQTLVEIAHRGWERLGAGGPDWRERNRGGWSTLLPHYVRAVDPTAAATITWHEEEADG
jgi:uncharacterized protein YndB with AHSA1/START domain